MKPPFSQLADSSQCPVEPSHVPYLQSYGRCSSSAAMIWGRYFHLLQPSGFCNPVCSILIRQTVKILLSRQARTSKKQQSAGLQVFDRPHRWIQKPLFCQRANLMVYTTPGILSPLAQAEGQKVTGWRSQMLISSTLLGIKENCLSGKALAPGRLLLSVLSSAPTAPLLPLSLRQ